MCYRCAKSNFWVITRIEWQATFIVSIKVNFHFRAVGETKTVIVIDFVEYASVPAVAPFVPLKIGNLRICGYTECRARFTSIALNFSFGIYSIKTYPKLKCSFKR